MNEENKKDAPPVEIEDIDRPIELKQSKIASAVGRVGVSGKGVKFAVFLASALVVVIGYGIMQAGPGEKKIASQTSPDADAPGQNQPINVRSVAEQKRNAVDADNHGQEQYVSSPRSGLQVRGESQPAAGQSVGGPSAYAQQTPAEQHRLWLERKRYERIEGRILAADAALTAELTKGNMTGGPMGGGMRGADVDEQRDPMARLASIRAAAMHGAQAAAAQQPAVIPAMLAQQPQVPQGFGLMGGDPNVAAQERNREFLREAGESGYLPEVVKRRMGGHELAAGSIIPAVMLTGINSDLPGVITAQVRQTVYDTFDESVKLIPQGTRLVGRYSSQIASGQERVLVAWDEMIFPNGARINLRGMSGVDGLGQAGFHDQVNTHFWRTWGSALMVSLLGVGAQLSQPQNSSYNTAPTTAQQAAAAAASSLNQAGSKAVEKNLNLSPTLTIRPGYAFNVIVNRSVLLPAYRD